MVEPFGTTHVNDHEERAADQGHNGDRLCDPGDRARPAGEKQRAEADGGEGQGSDYYGEAGGSLVAVSR